LYLICKTLYDCVSFTACSCVGVTMLFLLDLQLAPNVTSGPQPKWSTITPLFLSRNSFLVSNSAVVCDCSELRNQVHVHFGTLYKTCVATKTNQLYVMHDVNWMRLIPRVITSRNRLLYLKYLYVRICTAFGIIYASN